MLTDTSRIRGSVNAVSRSAVPRSFFRRLIPSSPKQLGSQPQRRRERAGGNRRGVRETIVFGGALDLRGIASTGADQRRRPFDRGREPPPPARDNDREQTAGQG